MSKVKKTKDYEMFKFRDDNREKINKLHVQRLEESISARNLLDLRPIIVNSDMEVLDGQHRLLAAKSLDLEIYYEVQEDMSQKDIIFMNIAKPWNMNDFFNYYVKNGYSEYMKLNQFMKQNKLDLSIACRITMGNRKEKYFSFKSGKYKFDPGIFDVIPLCWDTIEIIKYHKGVANSPFVKTAKFWKALIALLVHDEFDDKRWKKNLTRLIHKMTTKARYEDYLNLMNEIYNYKSHNKIELDS